MLRAGRRASRATLTAHLLLPSGPATGAASRAGLVVSKAVGPSVTRHRVSRRLRHLLRDRISQLPAGSRLVVRAAPRAAAAGSDVLGRDLDSALARLMQPQR